MNFNNLSIRKKLLFSAFISTFSLLGAGFTCYILLQTAKSHATLMTNCIQLKINRLQLRRAEKD